MAAVKREEGLNVGTYAILQGDLTHNNYKITYVGANFTITTRHVIVSAHPKTKIYGEMDPLLTYEVTSGSLASGDSFSGALNREGDDNVGKHAILSRKPRAQF